MPVVPFSPQPADDGMDQSVRPDRAHLLMAAALLRQRQAAKQNKDKVADGRS